MYLFIVSLHVLLSVMLILIIILQPGKGGDVGAAFGGGGSSSLFGPRGPASLLARMTTFVAVAFMGTSITLAWFSKRELLSNADTTDEVRRLEQMQKAKVDAEAEEPEKAAEEVATPSVPDKPEGEGGPDAEAPAGEE